MCLHIPKQSNRHKNTFGHTVHTLHAHKPVRSGILHAPACHSAAAGNLQPMLKAVEPTASVRYPGFHFKAAGKDEDTGILYQCFFFLLSFVHIEDCVNISACFNPCKTYITHLIIGARKKEIKASASLEVPALLRKGTDGVPYLQAIENAPKRPGSFSRPLKRCPNGERSG